MRFTISLMAVLMVLVGSAFAEQGAAEPNWVVDYAKSSIKFQASEQGKTFDGGFSTFTASIYLDDQDIENAFIRAEIEIASIDAGSKDRNSSLPSKDWFFAKKFPTATFTSSDVMKQENGTYLAKGALAIRGVSKDIELPFHLSVNESVGVAAAEFELDRTDFGVGQGAFSNDQWVSTSVTVSIDITAEMQR